MRWVIIIVGVLLLLTGAVWFLQGINVLPGSFMSGQTLWTVIGLVCIVVGAAVARFGYRRTPSNT